MTGIAYVWVEGTPPNPPAVLTTAGTRDTQTIWVNAPECYLTAVGRREMQENKPQRAEWFSSVPESDGDDII